MVATGVASACPFCSAPSLTLGEQVDQADVAVVVAWDSGKPGQDDSPGTTTYRVQRVIKGPQTLSDTTITLPRYRAAKRGDLFLLMGSAAEGIQWGSPLEVSRTTIQYITQAPPRTAPRTERLAYYLRFLEHPEKAIADDAYAEFANAPYEDIAAIRDRIPREKVRKWLQSPDTPVTRTGLYGLLLGLSGNEQDADWMRRRILEPTQDYRLGIEGIMSGYLLLTGERGLELLDRTKLVATTLIGPDGRPVLDKDGKPQPLPFSETYAAMQALRFMWTYGNGKIAPQRLQRSMRLLLDRPELTDLVIADLARWKDWSVRERLLKIYGREPYDVPAIKRAIVRYFLVCAKDNPDKRNPPPAHVVDAQRALKELRARDPATVRQAERFFFVD
ncbi:MAG: hypothetical protein D6725_08225 [Planctomycetota bacterium]|nr:MAG: hypothetical protein D6725_08225 [Planctomycetota bacterium]